MEVADKPKLSNNKVAVPDEEEGIHNTIFKVVKSGTGQSRKFC
jgi:hypothetical protein